MKKITRYGIPLFIFTFTAKLLPAVLIMMFSFYGLWLPENRMMLWLVIGLLLVPVGFWWGICWLLASVRVDYTRKELSFLQLNNRSVPFESVACIVVLRPQGRYRGARVCLHGGECITLEASPRFLADIARYIPVRNAEDNSYDWRKEKRQMLFIGWALNLILLGLAAAAVIWPQMRVS